MQTSIPKIIHYVWLGGKPLTPLAEKCIESWKKYCPDYQIVRWDESNFDVKQNRYCREAYDAKKWAFASDYVRLWVLVNEGGIYMDTDVEVLRPLDDFLELQAFSGFEADDRLSTGLMASSPHQPFFEKLLRDYDGRSFVKPNGSFDLTTNVVAITNACVDKGLVLNNCKQNVDGFTLFPSEYFSPKDWETKKVRITNNTYAIHHFDSSWLPASLRFREKVKAAIGFEKINKLKTLLGRM